MGRLRIRNPRNSDWIDICQSEWYVRNPANDGWRRILPSHGLKARHGTDNYWVNIDCLTEDECGDDPYGGTPDGTGENGSGPDLGGPDGGPGGPGGSKDPWGTWGGENGGPGGYWGSGGPAGGGLPWGPGGFGGGGGYPWGPGGGGYGNGGTGGGGGGGTGGGGGGSAGGPGNPSGSTGGGNSTGPGGGTFGSSYGCDQTVADQNYHEMPDPDYQKYRSYYHQLSGGAGNVHIRFLSTKGTQRYRIYYGDKLLHTTSKIGPRKTGEVAPRKVEYFYWSGPEDGDGIVRVEVEGNKDSIFLYTLFCPGSYYWDRIHPCGGVFSGGPYVTGGNMVQDMMHDMGTKKGLVEMMYHFMWDEAKCEVFYQGVKIAGSPGFTETGTAASGYHNGRLEFDFNPVNDDTIIIIRITSKLPQQTWTYNLWCPDGSGKTPGQPGTGRPGNPKWCGEENGLTNSGGAGVTIMHYDLGPDEGNVNVRYNMFEIEDKLSVYQDGNLVATTGNSVTGIDVISFDYDPSKGRDISVKVEGEGETTWAYVVDCAELILNCGETYKGSREKPVGFEFGGDAPANSYALVEYATVDANIATGSGAPNRILVENDVGVPLDDTVGQVLRWESYGFGALPIPVSGAPSISVSSPGSSNYWRATGHCPIVHPDEGPRFMKFSQGLPKLVQIGQTDGALDGAFQVALTQDMIMPGNSAFMAVNMFHTETGNLKFTGKADDWGSLLILAEGSTWEHVFSFGISEAVEKTISVAPGTYFAYVLVENSPDNTPSWFALKGVDTGNNKPILVSSSDWRGGMFEHGKTFGDNRALMTGIEALFFETEAEAQSYMSANPPPSMEDVFATWPRADGADYYTSSTGTSGDAAEWYYDNPGDRFIMGANSSRPNAILSPDKMSTYTFAATLTSADADDDSIGLVIAADVIDGVPVMLAVVRNQGGNAPNSGYGLIYVSGNGVKVLKDFGAGDTTGAWSGKRSRVEIRRRGDIVSLSAKRFNGSDLPDQVFNLNDFAETKKFMGESRYGYYTLSQRGSTYEDVNQPLPLGRVFVAGTDPKTWLAKSGNWEYQGTTLPPSNWIEWPSIATNPVNNQKFYVYNRVSRRI